MDKIVLAYCRDNMDIAERIDKDLSKVGIPFEHVTNRPGSMPGQFAAWVQSTSDPVILLITDNFLKNISCMTSALEMVKSLVRHKRLITVVADGWRKNTGSSLVGTSINTRFDRVVDAIQYLNFWQNTYLDFQSKYEEENKEVSLVRSISGEVGDLVNLLRDYGYMTMDEFEASDYQLFFKKFGIEEWYEQYQQMAHVSNGTANTESGSAHSVSIVKHEDPIVVAPLETESAPPKVEELPIFETPEPTAESIEASVEKLVEAKVLRDNDFSEMDAMLDGLTDEEEDSQEMEDEDALIDGVLSEMGGKTSFKEQNFVAKEEIPLKSQEKVEKEKAPSRRIIIPAAVQPVTPPPISKPTPEPMSPEKIVQDTSLDADYWFEKGDVEKGVRVLAVATEAYPNNDALRFEYAKALMEQKKAYGLAQEQLDKLLASGYVSADTFALLGDVAYAHQDYISAKNCWEKVAKLDPRFPDIYTKLGDLNDQHFRGFKKQAAAYYDNAIEQAPENASNFYKKGALLLEHLNEPERAARYLLQSLNLKPKNANAWSDLAIAYHHMGDEKRSDAAYKKAIELDPSLKTDTGDALFLLPQVAEKPKPKALQLTVMVTGSTSGIGRATAHLFARHGHRVILTGRRLERLESLKAEFAETYTESDCHILNFDVRDRTACQKAVESIPETWRNIDILINNAGLAKGLDPIHEGSYEHWDIMIDTNLKGLLNMTRMIAPWMVARKKGHIVNLGSSAGKEAYANGAVYCATKFGVEALTRAMRIDLHKHNIRVSQVSPGHVEETEFAVTRFDGDKERAKIYEDFKPLSSPDVADAIYFIATRPAHVNIQDIYMLGTQQASATIVDRSGRD